VSPQKSATTTVSRKPAETKSVKSVKLRPPDVARSIRLENSPPPLSSSPPLSNWKATSTISGSSTMKPSASWVRRRDACRRHSCQTLSVRPGR
jgi:hypothetical protein